MRLVRPFLVLLLLPVVPLTAGASVQPPELAGSTVVTAARSGYVDVGLSRDVRLSPRYRDNPDVSVTGQGRLVGLWLEALDPTGDQLEVMRVPSFLGGRTRTSGTTEPAPQCSSDPLGLPSSCSTPTPKAIVLHRGRYRLTVLTDGHPLTLRLHLSGLGGSARLRPVHALRSAELPLPLRETVGDRVVTYGATGPVAGRVRAWVAATATTSGTQVDGWSLCERHDAAQDTPFAYSPACPGGTSGGYDLAVRDGRYGVFGAWVGGVESAPNGGLGGSFTNDAGVRLGPTLGVWLQVP
jgi:hypothetical protein